MWDVAADTELDIEFLLLHKFYGRNRFNSSKNAIQAQENKLQIMSEQSTRVSAAQR